ncbi:chemotaxis protein CheW [Leptolyngbya sp. FACHB-541]|uniref:chemotaxis protein CheW n=1 Tax=Leptolyngbya sp. FACHB-541 TaxID=2692810 RepID=UPI00168271D2|nr:chemotaxis protein CheW [Leptolyngbya sp. FACHB-541]MBD1997050.1 chemotaxis protein CheW [Leptolyngbya sp. FACHB-541]
MSQQSYFTFSVNQQRCGIDTMYVEEVFALPDITPTQKASRDIVGIIDFQGESVPVMDLNLTLGHSPLKYRLTDSLVILKWEDLRVGIIVNQIDDIRTIPAQEINTEIFHDQEWTDVERKKIIAGIISDENIIILSNPGNWLWYAEIQELLSTKDFPAEFQTNLHADQPQDNGYEAPLARQTTLFPNATPQEREIFRKRANNLKVSVQPQDSKDLKPLVVVALGDDFFGIDVEVVREFVDVRKVTPVPCCPSYIVGNMNLRGEILTLIDLHEFLDPAKRSVKAIEGSKTMVIEVRNVVVGVMVKEIGDTMFLLDQREVMKGPNVSDSINLNKKYLQGIASYHERAMTILDMERIFFNSGLIIDEAI